MTLDVRGRLARALPGASAGRRLAVMAVVDGTGTGLFLTASTLFFVRKVGLTIGQLGLGLALAGVVSLVTTVPIGHLADRLGARRVLVVLSLWRAVGFAAYSVVHGFDTFLLVVCLLGVPNSAASPVLQALVNQAVGDAERVRALAAIRAARNVGFTIGAAAAGVAVGLDTRAAYLAAINGDALSFVAVAVFVATMPLLAERARVAVRRGAFAVLSDLPYVSVAALNTVLCFHMTLLGVAMPLWVGQHTRAPRSLVSVLVVVNTVMAVALQMRASRGSDTVRGASGAQLRAGLALAVCCLLYAVAGPMPALAASVLMIAGTVALTGGELWQSAGGWGLSYLLADSDRQGSYLALFGLGLAAQQILAPLVVTGLVIAHGAAGWAGLAVAVVACGAASAPAARWAEARVAARAGAPVVAAAAAAD